MKKLMVILMVVCLLFSGCKKESAEPMPSESVGQTEQTESPTPSPVMQTIGTVFDVDTYLNIRSGPGTDYDTIGKAKAGDRFVVITAYYSEAWHQIEYEGGLAYVHVDYLELSEEPMPEQ